MTSRVQIHPMDDILTRADEKRAFLLGLATYLKRLNGFASSKKTPNLTEYNVGGVISIVEQIETLANTYKGGDGQLDSYLKEDDHFNLLVESWFCFEDCKNEVSPDKVKEYFNQDYDKSGTLPLRLGQFLLTLEAAINKLKFEMFKVSQSLLARYTDYLKKGDSFDPHDPEINGYDTAISGEALNDLKGLLASFKTLYKMKAKSRLRDIEKSLELRKAGNNLMRSNRHAAAIAKYTEALAIDPQNHVLLSNRGAIFTELKDITSALEDLEASTKINPDYETAWTRLAYVYLTKNEPFKALQSYAKSIKLSSDKKMSPQYIKKLITSLRYAQARATETGSTESRIKSVLDTIQAILRENEPSGTSSTAQTNASRTAGTSANAPQDGLNNSTPFAGIFNGENGLSNLAGNNPHIVTALNGLGSVIMSSQVMDNVMGRNPSPTERTAQGTTQAQRGQNQTRNTGTHPQVQTHVFHHTVPLDQAPQGAQTTQSTQGAQATQGTQGAQGPQAPNHADFLSNIQSSLPEGLQGTIGNALRFAINNINNHNNQINAMNTATNNTTTEGTDGTSQAASMSADAPDHSHTHTTSSDDEDPNDEVDPADFDLD